MILFSLLLLANCTLLHAADFPATAPSVTISQQANRAQLSNGIVDVTIDTPSAEIISIRYQNHEMVNHTGPHKGIYFSRDGGANYENLPHCVGTIITNTPDMAEISCKHIYSPDAKDKHAWDVDVHFILRRGMSGVYVSADVSHPANYPKLGIGEWRMVWSMPENPRDQLENIYVDAARHWRAPTSEELSHALPVRGPKEISLLTTGPWKDRLDCKYMYAANYWDLGCWGFASDEKKIGAFVVFGSHEFFNDGPFKQDLTAAVGTTLLHLNMNHYNGTPIHVDQGQAWEKFYGPWLIYLNDKPTGDACWRDAQQQASIEQSQWPYDWLADENYPRANQRGSVHGKLIVHDALKPALKSAGAWIGLAQPEDGPHSDFQFQSAGYQFWTHIADDGSFSIPAVRPGNYTLYACVTGAVGDFTKTGIVINADQATDAGDSIWDVPHHGKSIAWEIGTADRRSTEFAHGKDFFQPLLYQKLPSEISNPLNYDTAKSNCAIDWNYAQTHSISANRPAPQQWRIHFNLEKIPTGDATLTLAFAGADRAKLSIFANDQTAPLARITPENQGGNALVRESDHSKYSVAYFAIPATSLHAGANTISLQQTSLTDASFIMYDYLNLELP